MPDVHCLCRARLRASPIFAVVISIACGSVAAASTAEGVIYEDRNGNAARDAGEPGLPDVRVSNGRDVVTTDAQGRYTLPVDDDDIIFVIKPRDWISPVDALNIARFYYVHKPAGSPNRLQSPGDSPTIILGFWRLGLPNRLEYAGVSPTGPLPESIDFPLVRHPEPDKFRVVALGDPQPRTVAEVDYFAHDVVEELIGVDAAFGLSLGDVVFDTLSLYGPYNAVVSTIGIPWFNIHGNHDMNYDVKSDELADETWERVFGPPTYSFDWGGVHFIILDNVMYDGHVKKGQYHSELGRHLTFVENDLKHVPDEKLVVLMMHIPIVETSDRAKLFALLQERPHTFSISGHWHIQQHFLLGPNEGWHGAKPHHHLVHATACGSWWQGAPDEFGIPHAMMRDGTPNGHSIITFDGHDYSIRFKTARRPATDQMSIFAPSSVSRGKTRETEVIVNVYAGSSRSTVEMRVVAGSPWVSMTRVDRPDPFYSALVASQENKTPPNGEPLRRGGVHSAHLWTAKLPADLPVGPHVVEVRTCDMFNQTASGRRVIRVLP